MSEWIESHVEIGEHPKTITLAAELGVRQAEAVGLLHLLWHFTMKFAWRDGNLEKFSDVAIARGSKWEGDPMLFLDALRKSGFIEGLQIHDWMSCAGKFVSGKIYNELRRKTAHYGALRRKTAQNGVKTPPLTVPYRTVPHNVRGEAIMSECIQDVRGEGNPSPTPSPLGNPIQKSKVIHH